MLQVIVNSTSPRGPVRSAHPGAEIDCDPAARDGRPSKVDTRSYIFVKLFRLWWHDMLLRKSAWYVLRVAALTSSSSNYGQAKGRRRKD